jgi:hypothetical protein
MKKTRRRAIPKPRSSAEERPGPNGEVRGSIPRGATTPVPTILAACSDGDHDDCPGVMKHGGRRYVCTCEHHVEAGTVDPKEFGFDGGGLHA